MNRHIISEFERVAPKCSLICGKMRGGLPKQGDVLRVRTLPLRGIFARTTRRQPSARSAENPSAAWKPINSPDSGKHPMRKTITAVARDATIWLEHKRRQRSGEQDERRDIEMGGSVFHLALPNDGKRANDQHGRRARQDEEHRAPAERRAQRATDNRADEYDVILAERKRGVSPSCAENRCRGEKICSYQKNEASNRAAARSRLFPIQKTTRPQGFPPWGREGVPQQKEAQLCRESRATRASRRRWGRASR